MDVKVTNAGSLKVGSYVILDDIPCIIKSIQTSKTGKHGHSKSRIEAIGIIEGQKKILVMPGHDKVKIPIIEKKTAQVLSISRETASVMDADTYETFDMKIPEDMRESVHEGDQVIYWQFDQEKIMKQKK